MFSLWKSVSKFHFVNKLLLQLSIKIQLQFKLDIILPSQLTNQNQIKDINL